MDWKAQVLLPSGQIKTIIVSGYDFPSDAEAAALSQSGAKKVVSITYHISKPNELKEESLSYHEDYVPRKKYKSTASLNAAESVVTLIFLGLLVLIILMIQFPILIIPFILFLVYIFK